jgi:hypothetical protein
LENKPFKIIHMKVFNLTAQGQKREVVVKLHNYYQNNRLAIQLDTLEGEPYAVLTVNMPDVLLADNEVLIKDYSENEGMYDFLIKNNIVTPTPNGVQSGHVWLPVAIVNDESVWGEVPNAYCMDEEPEYDNATPLVAPYVNVENVTNTPNSNGWISMNNKLDPAPDEINTNTGMSMWKIKGYKIWANSYKQALELLPMIESF